MVSWGPPSVPPSGTMPGCDSEGQFSIAMAILRGRARTDGDIVHIESALGVGHVAANGASGVATTRARVAAAPRAVTAAGAGTAALSWGCAALCATWGSTRGRRRGGIVARVAAAAAAAAAAARVVVS